MLPTIRTTFPLTTPNARPVSLCPRNGVLWLLLTRSSSVVPIHFGAAERLSNSASCSGAAYVKYALNIRYILNRPIRIAAKRMKIALAKRQGSSLTLYLIANGSKLLRCLFNERSMFVVKSHQKTPPRITAGIG